jgi:hypothetical protein
MDRPLGDLGEAREEQDAEPGGAVLVDERGGLLGRRSTIRDTLISVLKETADRRPRRDANGMSPRSNRLTITMVGLFRNG